MSESVGIRPYLDSDIGALMELWAECYGEDSVDRDLWIHRHFGLPGVDQGMMVVESAGGLVGMQPMECYPFRLYGEKLRGAVLTGVMVSPAYRRRGVFTQLVRACERRAWELGAALVTTMPNALSRPGFVKQGYMDPGERRLLVLPLRPSRLVRRRLGLLGALASPAAALLAAVVNRRRGRGVWGGIVQEVGSFDSISARPADVLAVAWPGLVQVRDAAWLEWRYPAGSPAGYRRFVAWGSPDEAEAFVVTAREEREGLQVGYLVDFAGVDESALSAAISYAIDELRRDGAELVLAVVSSGSLARTLRRAGFLSVPRRLAPKRFFTVYQVRDLDDPRLRKLDDIDRWYQTLGDWDTI